MEAIRKKRVSDEQLRLSFLSFLQMCRALSNVV